MKHLGEYLEKALINRVLHTSGLFSKYVCAFHDGSPYSNTSVNIPLYILKLIDHSVIHLISHSISSFVIKYTIDISSILRKKFSELLNV